MGLFVFPKSNSKEHLIEAVIQSMDLYENHPLSIHILEMAETYINDLKVYAQKDIDENNAKNDAYFAKKATYPLCTNCDNERFRAREDIDNDAGIYARYCSVEPEEVFHKEIFNKFKDYDAGHICPSFKWKEKDIK